MAVRHGGPHVHVLAGRVNAFGEVWRGSRDYARAMAAVWVIERDHGLVPVDGRVAACGVPLFSRACDLGVVGSPAYDASPKMNAFKS